MNQCSARAAACGVVIYTEPSRRQKITQDMYLCLTTSGVAVLRIKVHENLSGDAAAICVSCADGYRRRGDED